MTTPVVPSCEALGCCTDYAASVTGPCGTATVALLDNLTDVSWGRVLDEVSTAQVTVGIPGASPDCCEDLGDVRAWCHELHIYRCGVEVWSGPIVQVTFGPDGVLISARDNGAWLDRTVVEETFVFPPTDLAQIAERLVERSVPSFERGCTVVDTRLSGVVGARTFEVASGYVGDKLRELGRQGLDWTVLGRRLLLFGSEPLSLLGPLADEDFLQPLQVVEDGLAAANAAVVKGTGVVGRCEVDDNGCGRVTVLREESSITTQAAADALACALVSGGWPSPLRIDVPGGVPLAADAPICLEDMVPGVNVRVFSSATCRTVVSDMRLTSVQVQAGPDQESVQVSLAPAKSDLSGFDDSSLNND